MEFTQSEQAIIPLGWSGEPLGGPIAFAIPPIEDMSGVQTCIDLDLAIDPPSDKRRDDEKGGDQYESSGRFHPEVLAFVGNLGMIGRDRP